MDATQAIAAAVTAVVPIGLAGYAIAAIANPSNEELASTITNACFLYPLTYTAESATESLLAIQIVSAVLAAASFNYHENGVIGHRTSTRTFPREADLTLSLLLSVTIACTGILANNLFKTTRTKATAARAILIALVAALPYALDSTVTPNKPGKKSELLDPWAASAFAIGVAAAVKAHHTFKDAILPTIAILLPLAATAISQTSFSPPDKRNDERAVHAAWHITAAVAVAATAQLAGGGTPPYTPNAPTTITALYTAAGIAFLIMILADTTIPWTWTAPTLLASTSAIIIIAAATATHPTNTGFSLLHAHV